VRLVSAQRGRSFRRGPKFLLAADFHLKTDANRDSTVLRSLPTPNWRSDRCIRPGRVREGRFHHRILPAAVCCEPKRTDCRSNNRSNGLSMCSSVRCHEIAASGFSYSQRPGSVCSAAPVSPSPPRGNQAACNIVPGVSLSRLRSKKRIRTIARQERVTPSRFRDHGPGRSDTLRSSCFK
jgi:hypothetical protein